MPEVVSNTSPLQYLHQTELLSLLPAMYGTVTIPVAVADEIERGIELGIALPQVREIPWLRIREVERARLLAMVTDLDAGEREVLALADETADSLALLDDGWARRSADLLGIKYTGTLGVLVKAKKRGLVPEVRPVLDHLESLHFYLDPATRTRVLRLAEEI